MSALCTWWLVHLTKNIIGGSGDSLPFYFIYFIYYHWRKSNRDSLDDRPLSGRREHLGRKNFDKGNCTLINKFTIVKLSMTMRVCFHVICSVRIILRKSSLLGVTKQTVLHTMNCIIVGGHIQHQRFLSKIIWRIHFHLSIWIDNLVVNLKPI